MARSLGETGATMVVSSIYTTAPIAVIRWVSQFKFGSASFLGSLLIVMASAIILPIEFILQRRGVATFKLFSTLRVEEKLLKSEKFASRKLSRIKDVVGLIFILLVVILPIVVVLNSVALSWHQDPDTGKVLTFLTNMVALQLLFGLLGYLVLKRLGYFGRFVWGDENSAGSYALVCPGVALSVMLQFYVNKGFAASGLIAKYSVAYWSLTSIAILLQIATIVLVFRLNAKHFGRARRIEPVTA